MREPEVNEIVVTHLEEGDTLSEMAARYGVSVEALQLWNGIENPDYVQTGQRIVVYASVDAPGSSESGAETAAIGWDAFAGGVLIVALGLILIRGGARRATGGVIGWPGRIARLLFWSFAAPFKASFKGKAGELLVQTGGALMLPSSVYRQYHDVTLPTARGTTQIDHIVVSVYGVFVVETKNWSGWIFGRERDRRWTQVLRGGKRRSFLNPLRQNQGHVRAVQRALGGIGLPSEAVKPVVIFVGRATLKRATPENVTVGLGGIRYIRSFRIPVLSKRQVERICQAIESKRLKRSRKTHRQHKRYVHSRRSSGSR